MNRFSLNGEQHSPAPKLSVEERKKKLVPALLAEYERANQKWHEAIEWMLEIPLRVETSVLMGTGGDFNELSELLAYRTTGSGLRTICYGFADGSSDENGPRIEWTPILSCTAEKRISALEFIDSLKEAVVKAGEAFLACHQ